MDQFEAFLQFVGNMAAYRDNALSPTDLKAVRSLQREVAPANARLYSMGQALDKWMSRLTWTAVAAPSTRRRYLRSISRLYSLAVEAGVVGPTDDFQRVRALIPADDASALDSRPALAVARQLANEKRPGRLSDLFLLAVMRRGESIGSVVSLKRDDITTELPQASAIALRNAISPRQEYVLQFDQGSRRKHPLTAQLERQLSALLAQNGCVVTQPDQAVAAAWIEAASEAGIADDEIRAALAGDVPASHAYLATIPPATLRPGRLAEITASAANAVIDYTEHWHLVYLYRSAKAAVPTKGPRKPRAAKSGHEISAERLRALFSSLHQPVTAFYPYHEIVRRIGRRLESFQQPYIAEFMFVRASQPTLRLVEPELSALGRLLRDTTAPGRPLHIVPDSEMLRFQTVIGQFSDATPLLHSDERPATFCEGSLVGIKGLGTDSMYQIVDVNDDSESRTSLRLALPSGGALTFTIDSSKVYQINPNQQ